jgi:hypothetical protein
MHLEYIWAGLVVDQATAEHMLLKYEPVGDSFTRMLAGVMCLQQGPDDEAAKAVSGWSVLQMRWMPGKPKQKPVCVLA